MIWPATDGRPPEEHTRRPGARLGRVQPHGASASGSSACFLVLGRVSRGHGQTHLCRLRPRRVPCPSEQRPAVPSLRSCFMYFFLFFYLFAPE